MNVKQRRRPRRDQGWQRFMILASAVAGAYAMGAMAAIVSDLASYVRWGHLVRGFSTGIAMLWGMSLGAVVGIMVALVCQGRAKRVGGRERGSR